MSAGSAGTGKGSAGSNAGVSGGSSGGRPPTGSGGSGGRGGAGRGTVDDAGEGGEPTGDAGDNGTGGSTAGVAGTGAGGNAGTSGAGDGSGGTAGVGGSGGAPPRTSHWLLYRHQGALYAYDVETFPALEGTLLAASASLPDQPWSPDGSKVAYNSGSSFYVRDMRTRTPGEPINLGATAVYVQWSGDSNSIIWANTSGANGLIGVNEPGPINRQAPGWGRWAPTGNQFAYVDEDGISVVRITDGVPGTASRVFDGGVTGIVWSHDATRIATWDDGGLSLIDLRGDSPVVTEIFEPVTPGGQGGAPGNYRTVDDVVFTADDAKLVFKGVQTRSNTDLWVVSTAAPFTPTMVNLPLPSNTFVVGWVLSPTHQWLSYMTSQQVYAISDFTGSSPVTTTLPAGLQPTFWVPGEEKLLARNSQRQYVVVDGNDPLATPTVALAADAASPSMGGPGSSIAYSWFGDLLLDDLQGPSTPPTAVAFSGEIGSNMTSQWSRDAGFIVTTSVNTSYNPDRYYLHLLRVEGTNASSAIALQGISNSFVSATWQP